MLNNRIVFLTISLLLSPAGYGDELNSAATDTELWKLTPSTKLSFSSEPILQSDRPLVTTSVVLSWTDNWREPIADFDFQDINELKRISQLRSLSLLTLAEFRRSRLFLGVNTTGVVGFHFGGTPLHSDRHLEIARMPYLKSDPVDDSANQLKSDKGTTSDESKP